MGYALRKLYPPKIDGRTYISNRLQKWKPRLAEAGKIPDCDEVACERVRSYLFELGRLEKNLEHGWMAHAAAKAGINYGTARSIIHRDKTVMGLHVAKQISSKTGIPVHVFYDVTAP